MLIYIYMYIYIYVYMYLSDTDTYTYPTSSALPRGSSITRVIRHTCSMAWSNITRS